VNTSLENFGVKPVAQNAHEVMHCTLVTDGTTGQEWILRLMSKGIELSDNAKAVLNSPDFKPTTRRTIEVGILKASQFIEDERKTERITAEASRRGWSQLDAEATCLILEKLSLQECKKHRLESVVVLHKPINNSEDTPSFLGATILETKRMLIACMDKFNGHWNFGFGFAFEISELSRLH